MRHLIVLALLGLIAGACGAAPSVEPSAAVPSPATSLLAAGGSPTPGPSAAIPSPSASAPASVATPTVEPSTAGAAWTVEPSAAAALTPDLLRSIDSLSVLPATGAAFDIQAATVTGDWAVASAGVVAGAGPLHPSETIVILAHQSVGTWQVASDRDTAAFCALLADAPPGLLGADGPAYFVGCHK